MANESRTRGTAARPDGTSYERAGDLVGALFGSVGKRGLTDAQRAARAWYASNGDRERAHTTGVWLRKSGKSGVDPTMVVRLDSNLLAQELATNKDLYLARIARMGVRISDIRFSVGAPSRARMSAAQERTARTTPKKPLPPLDAEEIERVRQATEGLPHDLRQSVSRAMCASIARAKRGG